MSAIGTRIWFQSTRPRGARPLVDSSTCAIACFNPRARVGRDVRRILRRGRRGGFNPRARVGRDDFLNAAPIHVIVSIHAPAWGATGRPGDGSSPSPVSIHAPAWGATARLPNMMKPPSFQSTRPRGARPDAWQPSEDFRRVSIHAPAWGATGVIVALSPGSFSFNPRARVGRDTCATAARLSTLEFQSTRPRGARQDARREVMVCSAVSIHAPAWGATSAAVLSGQGGAFQSTRPRGARPARCAAPDLRSPCFNPRARVGRDTGWTPTATRLRCFNPRARVGRDQGYGVKNAETGVSIHAPAWGATRGNGACCGMRRMFQSTRPRGARRGLRPFLFQEWLVSIHAPAWGATLDGSILATTVEVSIHAPAWGATRRWRPPLPPCGFQSTRPRGARQL